MKDFEYKNNPVFVKTCKTANIPIRFKHRACFCCNKPLNEKTTVLLLSNHEYMPDTVLHEECANQWANKTDELCDDIVSAYHQFRKLYNVFGWR